MGWSVDTETGWSVGSETPGQLTLKQGGQFRVKRGGQLGVKYSKCTKVISQKPFSKLAAHLPFRNLEAFTF